MITKKSDKDEIKELQRLLVEMRLLVWDSNTVSGEWGAETQKAVMDGYARLNWGHEVDDAWISLAALAALAAGWTQNRSGGGGNAGAAFMAGFMAGGGGGHVGGGGGHVGGGGGHVGGGGGHVGGGGGHVGGGDYFD